MNKYPNFNSDNPFASQTKMFAHLDHVTDYIYYGDTTPVFMEVNLTNKCNLACSWCISENFHRNGEEIDLSHFHQFCTQFVELGGKALTFSGGGEPTIHSQFIEFVRVAREAGIQLGLMTNGAFDPILADIIAKNFEWTRISLDTLDPRLYAQWKGVDKVDRVLANIGELLAGGANVGINVNVSMMHTIETVRDIIITFKDLVKYIQFRPILPRYFCKEKLEINEDVWEYLSTFNDDPKINLSLDKLKDLRLGNTFPFSYCSGHVLNPILDANGDIKVCMYHPGEEEFTMGNIYEDSLSEIWNSHKRNRVLNYLNGVNYRERCQVCCKLTEINKFMEFVKDAPNIEDANFL